MIVPHNTSEAYLFDTMWRSILNDKSVSQMRSQRLLGYNETYGWRDSDYQVKIDKKVSASLPYARYGWWFRPLYMKGELKNFTDKVVFERLDSLRSLPYTNGIPSDAALRDIALKRYKSAFSENYQEFQSLLPLAEIRETRNLVKTTADLTERTLLLLLELKKGKAKRADIVKLASEIWLQYSFAISPTIGDIIALTEVVTDHLTRNDKMMRLSKGASKEWRGTSSAYDQQFITDCYLDSTMENYYSLGYRFTGAYNLLLTTGNDYNLRERMGFSLGALPSVAWELIPFSWVFDYFGTVGAYLEDIFSSPPGKTVYLVESRKYKRIATTSGKLKPTHPSYRIRFQECVPEIMIQYAFTRTVLADLPHRSLRFKTVDEIGKNALSKVLNLASILGASSKPRSSSNRH